MKHSPVLVLGLTTLTLMGAPAAHAKHTQASTHFDSPSLPPIAPQSDITAKPFGGFGFPRSPTSALNQEAVPGKGADDSRADSPTDSSKEERPPTDVSNLPLLDLLPSQGEPSSSALEPPDSSPSNRSNQSEPDLSHDHHDSDDRNDPALDDQSEQFPFESIDHLSDSDLYESAESAPEPAMRPDDRWNNQSGDASVTRYPLPEPFQPSRPELKPDRSIASATTPDSSESSKSVGLDFTLPPSNAVSAPSAPRSKPPVTSPVSPEAEAKVDSGAIADATPTPKATTDDSLDALFAGDSDSLVAIAVGSAEGTRTPEGGKNPAYQGHVDPGNGVWNLGSFSYQHGANSPEEADAKQLARLRSQAEAILEKATAKGLDLTLEEKLNGIDLANQAPKAALDHQGYIDRLAEAYARGMSGSDAILWARVQSFIDPYTQTWDAPGLGNSEDRITHDQERRMIAIAKAIATYLQKLSNYSPEPPHDQTSRSTAEDEGAAHLFAQNLAQNLISLFDLASTPTQTTQANQDPENWLAMNSSEAELPIVQQIIDIDLSELMPA